MDKKTKALKLALECIEAWDMGCDRDHYWRDIEAAITAIREALADSALDRMAENARELGLDYEPIVEQVEDSVGMGHKAWDMVDPKELAKEFHKALAEPPCKTGSQCTNKCQQCEQPAQQQEPVAVYVGETWCGSVVRLYEDLPLETPLYTSPQQHIEHCIWSRSGNRPCPHVQPSKPWVGLTDEERHACTQSPFSADNYRAIEAKLKEKNA